MRKGEWRMRNGLNFAKFTLGNKPVIGVEVGVDSGENARDVLDEWKEIEKLCLIDNYALDKVRKARAEKRIERYKDKIEWYDMKSYKATFVIPDNSVDFIYLDGDHTYDEFISDILNWYPKIKKGGVLCGHDCCAWYWGVLKAIYELRRIGWAIGTDMDDARLPKPQYSDWWTKIE